MKKWARILQAGFWLLIGLAMGAGVLLFAFGCSGPPQAHQTGPNSACFPGPEVKE